MPAFLSSLTLLADQNHFLAYFIIYFATILFGNIAAFISFWLALNGALGMWGVPILLLTLLLAVFSGDLLWYSIGKAMKNTRLGYFLQNRFAPQHEKIETALLKNGRSWIFMSKFLYSSSFPVIFTAGWMGLELKKFAKASFQSILVWLPILTGLIYGVFAGLTPLRAFQIFKGFEILFLFGLGIFFFAQYFIAKLLKKIFIKVFKNGLGNFNGNRTLPENQAPINHSSVPDL